MVVDEVAQKKLTKRQRRLARQQGILEEGSNGFKQSLRMSRFDALTDNQALAYKAFQQQGKNLALTGFAGTGKTFTALYLALREVMSDYNTCHKVYIVRSAVPSRDAGFLPGNMKEKAAIYETPYQSICTELFSRGDAYGMLKNKGIVEFITTSYIRGITLNDCIIVVDECQNMDWGELSTIITRCGNNCRIIFSGDYRQSDLKDNKWTHHKQDVNNFLKVLYQMKEHFVIIEFDQDDIVRSGLTKDFLVTATEMDFM